MLGATRARSHGLLTAWLVVVSLMVPCAAAAQGLNGTLVVTVVDQHGGRLGGATVQLSSPALIGGPLIGLTSNNGEWRFAALPHGQYALEISLKGFAPLRQQGIEIRAGGYTERTATLSVDPARSVMVQAGGSHADTRNGGLVTSLDLAAFDGIPWPRSSPFEPVKIAPGISPVSSNSPFFAAFGTPIDQNKFLLDGLDGGAPSNGVARTEFGFSFIQAMVIQSIGASAEYGNVQGAVVNMITKSGSERLIFDAAYRAQMAALTSQPVRLPYGNQLTGYERVRYRDFTTTLGGPIGGRLRFFVGYQYLRDYDSQPGANPAWPRKYEQDKIFAKLTWLIAPTWRLETTFHEEIWTNPERSTSTKPIETTQHVEASLPAFNFAHVTHAAGTTVLELTAGHFRFFQTTSPGGNVTTPNRIDRPGEFWSGSPQQVGKLTHIRTNVKGTVAGSLQAFFGARHDWKVGAEIDGGEHRALLVIPTLERFLYVDGVLRERTKQLPSNAGGQFLSAGTFVTDSIRMGNRVTVNAGARFDYARALSPSIPELDQYGAETGGIIHGKSGRPPTWHVVSPRLGMTMKLDEAGRTIVRGTYGLFNQGMLTGEISPFHPGQKKMEVFNAAGILIRTVDPSLLKFDQDVRTPYSHQFSAGVDREISGRWSASITYVRKRGHDFIGWRDVGGSYHEEQKTLPDGRSIDVDVLDNGTGSRRFELQNRSDFSLTYNGVAMVLEKRQSHGWHAFTSYTWSRAEGLQSSSGSPPSSAYVGTVGAPPALFSSPVTFGRDPNDIRNASGPLPSDRPHMLRAMGSADVPHLGLVVAANFQYLSGKPWAATATVNMGAQNMAMRVLLEPPGTRRLPSQTLLDFRVSRAFRAGRQHRIDIMLDVFNALNDASWESIETDDYFAGDHFGAGNVFVDPRRAMLSVRWNLGGI